MKKCEIGWVDNKGKATWDDNDAVGIVIHWEPRYPRLFLICANHAARVFNDPDMSRFWSFEPFESGPMEEDNETT